MSFMLIFGVAEVGYFICVKYSGNLCVEFCGRWVREKTGLRIKVTHFWYDVGIGMNDRCIEYILTRYYIPICIYDSMHTYTYTISIFISSLGKNIWTSFLSQAYFLSNSHHHLHISLLQRRPGLPSLWDCHSATGVAAGHFDRCLWCHVGPCRGEPMSWCGAGGRTSNLMRGRICFWSWFIYQKFSIINLM